MKSERIIIVILLLILAFSSGAQWSKAQEGTPPPLDPIESNETTQASEPQELAPAEPEATVDMAFPIQGRLTDAAGAPIEGTRNVTLTLYDDALVGVSQCTDTNNVSFTNGFFSTMMANCSTSDLNGQALWLGIKVGSDPEMTPRQRIGVVPYAAALRPGADIRGDTSYLFVPGTAIVPDNYTDTTTFDRAGSSVIVKSGSAVVGTRTVRFPIVIPAVAYGVNVRVTAVKVYYSCSDGSSSYISETELYKGTGATTFVNLVNDTTNRTSSTDSFYTLNSAATDYTLDLDSGMISVRLGIFFANGSDSVRIGGIRLTLVTNY